MKKIDLIKVIALTLYPNVNEDSAINFLKSDIETKKILYDAGDMVKIAIAISKAIREKDITVPIICDTGCACS